MGEERIKEMETRKPMPPRESEPPFKVAQGVARSAFTDCFNEHHNRVGGLTVESVKLYPAYSIPSYWRIVAVGEPTLPYGGGVPRYEGGSCYFEPNAP